MITKILKAMRADDIPAGKSGLWQVHKKKYDEAMAVICTMKRSKIVTAGNYTILTRKTYATLNTDGECVMEDTVPELQTHLNFVRRAKGDVLVTGLGLGCIVRGLLCKPDVTHITVIERDEHVLKLVLPYMPNDQRLHVVHADAAKVIVQEPFDYAWHDIWTDECAGEPSLSCAHIDLLSRYHKNGWAKKQGAWGFPKEIQAVAKRQPFWYSNYA